MVVVILGLANHSKNLLSFHAALLDLSELCFLTMEFVSTSKGGKKLFYKGYGYVLQKDYKNGKLLYECEFRRNYKQCSPTITVSDSTVVREPRDHSHAPKPGRQEAQI